MNNNDYYVYIHRMADNRQVFYIGKGRLRRSNNKSSRSIFWKRVVAKHGYLVEKTQTNMKEDDALLLEMWLIAKYKHLGYRLCNKTLGGDGCLGMTMSDESKKKCGEKNIGRKWSDERKRKQSERLKGKKMNDVHRLKMSIIAKSRGFPNRKICDRVVTSSEGVTYSSLLEARKDMAKRFGFSDKSGNIGLCCNGSRSSAFGLNWSYGEDKPNAPIGSKGRVIQEITTGIFYKSIRDFCSKVGGVSKEAVKNHIQTKTSFNGYRWRYIDED